MKFSSFLLLATSQFLIINSVVCAVSPCDVLVVDHTREKLPNTSQIVVVKVIRGSYALTSLCQWQSKAWHPVLAANFKTVIGKKGLALPKTKKEGDLKTPQGLFPIGNLFGFSPIETKMDYKFITTEDKFIDDVNSKDYNTWVTGQTFAKSYESLFIPAYEYGAVVNYNMNPTIKGAGSAIFIHLWASPNTPTSGCVATDKKNLLVLLRWLEKAQHPYIMIYAA